MDGSNQLSAIQPGAVMQDNPSSRKPKSDGNDLGSFEDSLSPTHDYVSNHCSAQAKQVEDLELSKSVGSEENVTVGKARNGPTVAFAPMDSLPISNCGSYCKKGVRGQSISFGRDPESSVQVDVVNCMEPGPSSPGKAAPPRESILRSDTKDLSQDKQGRYIIVLPPGKNVTETNYYFTVTDVAVRESARMQSRRVEIIRALTLIEPIDVNGPDRNCRKFLKLGYRRWVCDRARADQCVSIRQVFHLTEFFFFVQWSPESLRVVLLDPEGPVQEWNDKQREESLVHACVEINDFIVEINGYTQSHEMIREMVSEASLELKIHRDPPKMPQALYLEEDPPRGCCCVAFNSD